MHPRASSCEDARNEGAFHHADGHFRVLRVLLSWAKKKYDPKKVRLLVV